MSNHAHVIAGRLAEDAFWNDAAVVKLLPGGNEYTGTKGVPEHHLLFATSGTSGSPKWIAISKEALAASARAVNTCLQVDAESAWGLGLPVHHVGGFGVVARARAAGCALEVFGGKWDAAGFSAWLEKRRVTHTSLVATQVHDLVAAQCRAPNALVAVVIGGGRLDAVAGRAARDLGWPVLASYGMTEAASQIATQPPAALELPYDPAPIQVLPHWRVRADCNQCLEISGPALFSGTVRDGVYLPRVGDWHATRDRVSVTPLGLVPLGRADGLVKVAGELVDPAEAEARLNAAATPHGSRIAVVAVPDTRLGMRLELVAERSVPPDLLDAALRTYNAEVPRSQRIDAALFVEELPRGDLGKIQRGRLDEIVRQVCGG